MRGKVRKMKTVAMAAVLSAAFGAGSLAGATNETKSVELGRIVVEASRVGRTAEELPMPVRVLDAKAIAESGARNLVDLLEKETSSLNLIRTGAGNPALAQISLRGWGENGFGRVLVMVDGERLNFADMSAPLLSRIELGSISKVEILEGSGSVLYGDSASAGVINIVTEPDGYDEGGRVEVYGGSFETFGARASLHGGDREADTKYWANSGWEHSNGYRANNGWQLWNLNGGMRKGWENGAYLRISASYNDSDSELPGYLSADEWKSHPGRTHSPCDWYRRTTYSLKTSLEGVVDESNKVRLDMLFSHSKMHTRSYYTGSYTDYDPGNFFAPTAVLYADDYRQNYDLYSYELTPQWINTIEFADWQNEFIAGASYRYDRLHGDNRDSYRAVPDFWGANGITSTKYAFDRQSMGYFAQDTLRFMECVALEAGGRYQRTFSENTQLVHSRRVDDTYAANAALLFTPTSGLKTFVKFSRFFRNPFLDENPFKDFRAQKILSPETGWTLDAGIDWTFLDEFQVWGDVFYTKTEHEILYDKFIWGNNINSPSDIVRKGFTLGAGWRRDKFAAANVAYTFVDAEFDGGVYDGKDVPMAAESTLAANTKVWLWDECFVFGGYRFLSSRRAYSDFANEGSRLAGHGVFHVGLQYEPSFAPLKGFKFGATINNLFDRRYADCAVRSAAKNEVYYPATGRSFMLSVSYEF